MTERDRETGRPLGRRARHAVVVLWSAAAVQLAAAAAIIVFTIAQSMVFYAAQATGGTVKPSFWLQISWAVQSLPGVLLTVALACAVAPIFLRAVLSQRAGVGTESHGEVSAES